MKVNPNLMNNANLFDINATPVSVSGNAYQFQIHVTVGKTYTVSQTSSVQIRIQYVEGDTWGDNVVADMWGPNDIRTFTATQSGIRIIFYDYPNTTGFMFNEGSTKIDYQPYTREEINNINGVKVKGVNFSDVINRPFGVHKFTLSRSSTSDNYTFKLVDYIGWSNAGIIILNEGASYCTGVWAFSSGTWNYIRTDFDGSKVTQLCATVNYNSPRVYLNLSVNSGSSNVTISGGKNTSINVTIISG